jgi:hypothetical protein
MEETMTTIEQPAESRVRFTTPDKEIGIAFHLKLDNQSASCLHRSQNILRRATGAWVDKDHITRRALRVYLEYLKRCDSTEEELKEIIRAIDGQPAY